MKDPMNASGFVLLSDYVPDALQEVRYFSRFNFIGRRIDGYEEPVILITREAAEALAEAADALRKQGYVLKVFDAYRPCRAVAHFVRWSEDPADDCMRPYFYPQEDKALLTERGYISKRSGHSRGSTVDLTLFDMKLGRDADAGSPFDFFGEISHPDYRGELTGEQLGIRKTLADAMTEAGFAGIDSEWWHFTLRGEPYPDTYFDFPVRTSSVR